MEKTRYGLSNQEWLAKPRVTPMAGHRKATLRYCDCCEKFHRTHRAVGGPDKCEKELS